MDYLFLDTFALAKLTKSHYDLLAVFLKKHQLYLVISTVQLMEYYSPILEANDRTDRAVHLLTEHPFVIADVHDIFNKEEENYPAILKELPFRLNSTDVLDHYSAEEKSQILFQMLHHGIPEAGYNLSEWALRNNDEKKDWPDHVAAIIKNAEEKYLLKSKSKFLESHDLRFCWQIVDAIEKLNKPAQQDKNFKRSIQKLAQIRERKDTWRMRGIHLTSLLFWYDYIIAKKKIKPSDEGDFMHSFLFPYCKYVVTDNSRVDCLQTIQRKEEKYKGVIFLNIADFTKMIQSYGFTI